MDGALRAAFVTVAAKPPETAAADCARRLAEDGTEKTLRAERRYEARSDLPPFPARGMIQP